MRPVLKPCQVNSWARARVLFAKRIFSVECCFPWNVQMKVDPGTVIDVCCGFLQNQWPFQDPKMEVPTIYKACVRPMEGDIPPKYGLITVPPF